MMQANSKIYFGILCVCAFGLATGCATTPEPETVPVETIAAYDEKPDYSAERSSSAAAGEEYVSEECRELQTSIENWQKAYTASVGLGALGFATGVAGLLTGNEDAQKVGGVLGALGTLSQATTATGAQIQRKKALERDCSME